MKIPIETPCNADERTSQLKKHFEASFGGDPRKPYFLITVPLRICPLGAHSDHQGGTVTGLTIDRSVQLLGQATDLPALNLFSVNFNEQRTVSFDSIPEKIPGDWGNYARGMVRALREAESFVSRGFNAVIHGAMPIGGLSSSAAVSIAYARALEHVNHLSLSALETILLVRATENGYLGLHNGILDQSVIVSSHPNALTCIDCRSHEITSLAQERSPQPWEILVVYSGLSRQLTGTPFNQRVAECHEAARELLALAGRPVPHKPILGDVGAEIFFEYQSQIPETLQRRARHFFTEAARVHEGMKVWPTGDMAKFGALVTASGESSIVNFESGSPALIALYEILAGISGVYGTRFCGGGFQGCCLAIIDPSQRESIAEKLHAAYMARHPELEGAYSIHFCNSANSVSVEVVE
jgi:galactokinase/galacturonokinase